MYGCAANFDVEPTGHDLVLTLHLRSVTAQAKRSGDRNILRWPCALGPAANGYCLSYGHDSCLMGETKLCFDKAVASDLAVIIRGAAMNLHGVRPPQADQLQSAADLPRYPKSSIRMVDILASWKYLALNFKPIVAASVRNLPKSERVNFVALCPLPATEWHMEDIEDREGGGGDGGGDNRIMEGPFSTVPCHSVALIKGDMPTKIYFELTCTFDGLVVRHGKHMEPRIDELAKQLSRLAPLPPTEASLDTGRF